MRPLVFSGMLAAAVGVLCIGYEPPRAPAGDEPAARPPPHGAERFDKLVRVDMFAGFGGDEAALARGLALCDATLARDPRHAEALVWRGAARMFQAGGLFGKGQVIGGMSLWGKALKDMDEAVEIAPDNPGVRIPRAAVLMPAARNAPAAMAAPLLDRALRDFRDMERLQADKLDRIGEHPLGELRMGLADVYRLKGDRARSVEQLELVRKQLPDTDYARRAGEWLAARPDAKLVHQCIGCHGG